jgi:hypothetical protein
MQKEQLGTWWVLLGSGFLKFLSLLESLCKGQDKQVFICITIHEKTILGY